MDLFDILSKDERIIVLSLPEERSLFTWNKTDTIQWWRPVVRVHEWDYPSGKFDPNDWEEVGNFSNQVGLKTFEEAKRCAQERLDRYPFERGYINRMEP